MYCICVAYVDTAINFIWFDLKTRSIFPCSLSSCDIFYQFIIGSPSPFFLRKLSDKHKQKYMYTLRPSKYFHYLSIMSFVPSCRMKYVRQEIARPYILVFNGPDHNCRRDLHSNPNIDRPATPSADISPLSYQAFKVTISYVYGI